MTNFELVVHGQLNCLRLIIETVVTSVLVRAPEADEAVRGWRNSLDCLVRFKLETQPDVSHEDASLVIEETAKQIDALFERIEDDCRRLRGKA